MSSAADEKKIDFTHIIPVDALVQIESIENQDWYHRRALIVKVLHGSIALDRAYHLLDVTANSADSLFKTDELGVCVTADCLQRDIATIRLRTDTYPEPWKTGGMYKLVLVNNGSIQRLQPGQHLAAWSTEPAKKSKESAADEKDSPRPSIEELIDQLHE